jgi:hypothetical protein
MPKEAEPSSREKVPLRRGDACLYCRKRRIKCSAEKPSCNHCRGKRECSYDNGKPVSRVKQLEDKVAQLESMLQGAGGGATSRRPSEEESPEGGDFTGLRGGNTNSGSTRPTTGSFDTDNNNNVGGITQGGMNQGGTSGAFSFEGTGMDGIDTFDINTIQQSFNQATSGLSNDFLSFGGSMFGDTNAFNPPPTISYSQQGAATMFDFSTLDPNFMSLVNSFDNTLQPQSQSQAQNPAPSLPTYAPHPPQSQPSMFAATVMDEESTGLTPFLNQDYSPMASGPSTNTSTGMPLSGIAAAPTPGRHFENLSSSIAYHARPEQAQPMYTGEPNWNVNSSNSNTASSAGQTPSSGTGTGTGTGASSDHPLYVKASAGPNDTGADVLLSQALGDKSPEDPSAYSAQVNTSYSSFFQKPAESRAGLGAAMDQEGYELVGGWFDAEDLPRVARDHL